jgi:hypothetical protein
MVTEKELLQLEYDKKQMQFAVDGTLIINQKVIDEQTPLIALINESKFYFCPFCLERTNKYIIKNKALIECPNCLVNFKLKTLLFIQDCTNEEYAKWVFDYRLSGFFFKLKSGNNSFDKWNKKMKELGIYYKFWEEYKKLKGETKETNIDLDKELNEYIDLVILKIKSGVTKEEIIQDSYKYNLTDSEFHYCYNEAELKIKNTGWFRVL